MDRYHPLTVICYIDKSQTFVVAVIQHVMSIITLKSNSDSTILYIMIINNMSVGEKGGGGASI